MKRLYSLALLILPFFLVACGYQPIAYYAKNVLGNNVFVELSPNMENPEDSVKIKDAVNEAIASRLHLNLSSKENADTILKVDIGSITNSIVSSDTQGFATFYRVYVNITFSFKNRNKDVTFTNGGYYDYAASLNNPIVTDNNRSNAITQAAKQSIDKFISQLGYQNLRLQYENADGSN
ncbi:hypothetical protein BKH43_06030 [Helicobacter sp. 13S00401-1]|uniref:LPS assembly lipoprotein LptE n=1 Tax=Helicobacter sp. 13S00401-1 TaxID=1905758 RepID=UPI000BA551AF|nr:LPS assembly lipoprotein LptE [Helicobacter sp. 13S00401-1]PAF50049.1 hypothetical protein BKH43_06030 [Helicobacter sp. 13S00401-1]